MVTSEPPVSTDEKREALDAALNSNTFARSVQLRAFLRYICEREMAGRTEDLSEYQIAVEVLGRPKDFNLTEDSSVRNRAYELRQRLEKYYTSERRDAPVRIQIPRGGYVPFYTRRADDLVEKPAPSAPATVEAPPEPRPRRRWKALAAVAALCSLAGLATGIWIGKPHPPGILKEAWGPLADPADPALISIATNLYMLVRPHIAPHRHRYDPPQDAYSLYGSTRPLAPGTPLYMEPALLSVPLAEVAATVTLANTREAFGGSYQLLPESEAPVAALRGRNAMVIGSGTNSQTAGLLLRNLPLTIDYTSDDRFAVFDRRKPPGQDALFISQPTGDPVASSLYGLITVITTSDSSGKPTRTLVVSGSGSAGVQAAVEFFCSADRMREMKQRMGGFPPTYQIVVRAKTAGLRLISYEYVMHVGK
jgi:hypothetical protein